MTYEERIKLMGLKPFEKYGFLYHADISNQKRREALEFIDKYDTILKYKVSDMKGIKLFGRDTSEVDFIEPLLILSEGDDHYFVFNGHYTYNFDKDIFSDYEVYDKVVDYSKEDGYI